MLAGSDLEAGARSVEPLGCHSLGLRRRNPERLRTLPRGLRQDPQKDHGPDHGQSDGGCGAGCAALPPACVAGTWDRESARGDWGGRGRKGLVAARDPRQPAPPLDSGETAAGLTDWRLVATRRQGRWSSQPQAAAAAQPRHGRRPRWPNCHRPDRRGAPGRSRQPLLRRRKPETGPFGGTEASKLKVLTLIKPPQYRPPKIGRAHV